MEEIYHIPAMLKETIDGLAIKPNGVYVDVTFGGGGHSRAILNHLTPTLSQGEGERIENPNQHSPQGEGEGIENLTPALSQGEGEGIENLTPTLSQGEGEGIENLTPTLYQGEGEKIENLTPTLSQGEGERIENLTPTLSQGEGEGIGHLYSFDQDEDSLQNAIDDERWTFVHSNFRYLRNWMDYYGVKEIDGLLADLGVSFHHFDCPERGFSFRFSAPLDMRMNQTSKRTAADIVNGYSEEELAKIFWLYGEMKNGKGIAKNICKARSQKPILRTEELIKNLTPTLSSREGGIHILENGEIEVPAQYKKDLARLFQALRIEVNDEMGALREMLVAARDMLKPGGRIAILTYHSLEDRLVKNFLRSGNLEGTIEKDFYGNILTPFEIIEKGRTACAEEVERNPRSRSAKLRVGRKIKTPPDLPSGGGDK